MKLFYQFEKPDPQKIIEDVKKAYGVKNPGKINGFMGTFLAAHLDVFVTDEVAKKAERSNKFREFLDLVSMKDDVNYIVGVKQSFYNSMYPFNLFPDKGLQEIEFAPITFFYGGNGSGKTTLLNVLAEKLELTRHSPFNGSSLFRDYVKMCRAQAKTIPENSQILTSDDVFDYLLDTRTVNDGINDRRAELMQEYLDNKYAKHHSDLH